MNAGKLTLILLLSLTARTYTASSTAEVAASKDLLHSKSENKTEIDPKKVEHTKEKLGTELKEAEHKLAHQLKEDTHLTTRSEDKNANKSDRHWYNLWKFWKM